MKKRDETNGESVVLLQRRERSDDYRCWKCGEEFTLAADSNKHTILNKGHVCVIDNLHNRFDSRR